MATRRIRQSLPRAISAAVHRGEPFALLIVRVCVLFAALSGSFRESQAQLIPVTITEEEIREHVLGALAYLRQSNPGSWGSPEQQRATAVAILLAVDTAHARGIVLLQDRPLDAQVSVFRTPEFSAVVEGMPETTTNEIAAKLSAMLVMGESGGTLRRRLLESQNADGSWGLEPGRTGNPLDTSLAMLALMSVRQLDVPTDVCLAAAEYLADSRHSGTVSSDPETSQYGPLWPLSAEDDGQSHLVHASYGLHALRLMNGRVSNNGTRTALDQAQGYIASATDSSAPTNTVEENALAFTAILGLQLWGNPREPIRAILDTDSVATPYTWANEAGQIDAYTTALAARALAMWLPEQNAGKPDLTTRASDLVVDTTTNKLRVLYRNQGESPAASGETFTVGETFLAGAGPSLVYSGQFVAENSYVESDGQLSLAAAGPGSGPIAVAAHLDPDNAVNEADESNNIMTYPLDRNRLGLDLAITPKDMWVEYDAVNVDWIVHAEFRTIGRYTAPSDQFNYSLESSTNGIIYSTISITPIVNIGDTDIHVSWIITNPPSTGNRYYRARASSPQECSGCLSNNSAQILVAASTVNNGNNITISQATTNPAQPGIGQSVSIDVAGTASYVTSAPTVSIRVYDPSNLTNAIGELASFQVSGTWAATITDVVLPAPMITFSDTGSPQAVTKLLVHVDAGSVYAETNEGDNWYPIEISFAKPDLVLDPSSLTISNTDLGTAPDVEVSVGLRNAGPMTASLEDTTVDFSITYTPAGSSTPVTDIFASVSPGDISLGFNEGLHLSAMLTPPVGEATIMAEIVFHNSAGSNELTMSNNLISREVTFTRETLTIALLPNLPDNHYDASNPSVRNMDGIIVRLTHTAPPGDPFDPADGIAVTYEAFIGPVGASTEDLIRLNASSGGNGSFRIPIHFLRTELPGTYEIHGTAFEDGRIASTASESFSIADHASIYLSASVRPSQESLGDGDSASMLSGDPSSPQPALFITLRSVSNVVGQYGLRAMLERADDGTGVFTPIRDPALYLEDAIVSGSPIVLNSGSQAIVLGWVIPNVNIHAVPLTEGLYRYRVEVYEYAEPESTLRVDVAGFRVAEPDDYVIGNKFYIINEQHVESLRPIEGQVVSIILTLSRN